METNVVGMGTMLYGIASDIVTVKIIVVFAREFYGSVSCTVLSTITKDVASQELSFTMRWRTPIFDGSQKALVAELADAYGSGPYGATRGGSSPLVSSLFLRECAGMTGAKGK